MLRICDSCGEVDDAPRHVIGFEQGVVPVNSELVVAISSRTDLSDEDKKRIVEDIIDTTLILKHMHCCKNDGCPTGDCNNVPDLYGDALRAHITGSN